MANAEMDWAKLLSSERRKSLRGSDESIGTGVGREEIERDYDRVLFAAPTRRLADKTQVFPMETNDSVRTRLTHSHEVSNLARSIGVRLVYNHREEVFGQDADTLKVERRVPALLAAVGLAHDLGNPPFGHQGEQTIKRWCEDKKNSSKSFKNCPHFTDFSQFDGNCQTFRLLTKLQILNDEFGLNLTCATLAALMKYPVFSKDLSKDKKGFKKFGLFHSERDVAKEVWKQTGLAKGIRHPLVYVMEACDDIAYSVIDAEDTVKKGYASFIDLIDFLRSGENCQDAKINEVIEAVLKKNEEFKREQLSPGELNELSMQMFRVKAIALMVESATRTFVQKVGCILAGGVEPKFEIIENSEVANLCSCLKEFDKRYGFHHPDVLRLELQGDNYIGFVMDALWRGIDGQGTDPFASYAYGKISENYRRVYENSDQAISDKLHLLCDQISGMTESYLVSVHDELLKFFSVEDTKSMIAS